MEFLEKRSQRKATKLTNYQKNLLKQKINLDKDFYEEQNPCGYNKIYPVQAEIYEMIEVQAIKIF